MLKIRTEFQKDRIPLILIHVTWKEKLLRLQNWQAQMKQNKSTNEHYNLLEYLIFKNLQFFKS